MPFQNRADAGRRLAAELEGVDADVVLALPRGGVPVAAEVADSLELPLDVLVVRKIGVPFQPELGMGAIGEGGVRVVNTELVDALGLRPEDVDRVAAGEAAEVDRRVAAYRGGRPAIPVEGQTVVLVDDGIATGFTARAGIELLREQGAGTVILATPVASPETVEELRAVADEVIAVETPSWFMAIGQWYADFHQVSDHEVTRILDELHVERATGPESEAAAEALEPAQAEDVEIGVNDVRLPAVVSIPTDARGVVLFAHGAGSSRLSPRNTAVAEFLQRGGLATVLFDLLTQAEAADRANVFDIGLLADRLAAATTGSAHEPISPRCQSATSAPAPAQQQH